MKTIKLERDTHLTHDCVGEFTVPDYLPAVEKLLSAECALSPDGIYLKSGSGGALTAELGGEASFYIVWQGENDGENAASPVGAAFRCDYDSAVALGTLPTDCSPRCRAVTTAESVFCRVTGPRKLTLRARLATHVTVTSESEIIPPPECADASIETLEADVSSAVLISGASRDLFSTADFISEGTPLYCRGGVRVDTASPASPSEIRLTGEVLLTRFFALDGTVRSESASVPFDELTPLDLPSGLDLSDALACRGYGNVSSLSLRESESGYSADITYELFAEAMFSPAGICIKDAYSTAAPSSATYRDIDFTHALACASTSLTVNEKAAVSKAGTVELVTANAEVEAVRAERGKLKLTGSLTGTALIKSNGERENVPYTVPWTCEMPALSSDACDSPDYMADICILSVSGRADGELSVNAELSVSVTATARERVRVLDTLSIEKAESKPVHSIRVCYPSGNEAVWDIAKRFRVPVARVVNGNVTESGELKRVIVV